MNYCSQLDEFFDGELDTAAAAAFRDHLTTCDRCQAALRGRMQEAMVTDEAQPAVLALPVRRTRTYAMVGAAVALAAAVALVWQLKRPAPPQVAQLAVSFEIQRGDEVLRDKSPDAIHVKDRVHVPFKGPVWIYHGDHKLLLACPGSVGCRPDGAYIDIVEMGTYSVVTIAPTTIVPHGDYDTDVAALEDAHVAYHPTTFEVR